MESKYETVVGEIEAFVWIGTMSSVSGAAKRVGIAPATLTDRLTSLERVLGKLFERGASGAQWRLTDLGASLLPDAELALETLQRMRSMEAPRERQVRLAVIQSVEHTRYKRWRGLLHESHPEIAIELTVETTEDIGDLLKRGLLDAAISMAPHSGDDIVTQPLPPLPMAFIGNAEVYTKAQYELDELATRLLTFQRHSRPWRNLVSLLAAVPNQKNKRLELSSSIPSMIDAVEANRAVATLPEAIVASTRSTKLRVLPCNVQLEPLRIFLSWPKHIGSAHARIAIESLRTHLM